ncbi:hypothetical protein MRY87_07955 [bacterium]|nr:hypothetical protein [bacterium]
MSLSPCLSWSFSQYVSLVLCVLVLFPQGALAYGSCNDCREDHERICRSECEEREGGEVSSCLSACAEEKCASFCGAQGGREKAEACLSCQNVAVKSCPTTCQKKLGKEATADARQGCSRACIAEQCSSSCALSISSAAGNE